MRVLGLIPARGGSKGIPGKNRKELYGKPLMQYTIEAALNSKQLDSVVFSSEDAQLIELAASLGADIPFVRPTELALDTSGSLSVAQHALNTLEEQGKRYDAVCLLQVTNPFRTTKFIDEAVLKFKNSNMDSLLSVLEVPHEYNPHWVFKSTTDGLLELATGEAEIIKRRQDLPKAFIRDGSIYITRSVVLLEEESLYGKNIGYIESDPSRHVNIDTMTDWNKAVELAQKLLN